MDKEEFRDRFIDAYNTAMKPSYQLLPVFQDQFDNNVDVYPDKEEMLKLLDLMDTNMEELDTYMLRRSSSSIEHSIPNTLCEQYRNMLSKKANGTPLYAFSPEELLLLFLFYSDYNTGIIVYWPSVTIENEVGNTHDITDLYAKIPVYKDLTINYFVLNRSSYTESEFYSNFLHSHISTIDKRNPYKFQSPCTGQGPINQTINNLRDRYDESLLRLFTVELDKYVHVESLKGIPYKKMSEIGKGYITYNTNNTYINCHQTSGSWRNIKIILHDFVKYLAETKAIKFVYNGIGWYPVDTMKDLVLKVSNMFIRFVNHNIDSNTYIGRFFYGIEDIKELFLDNNIMGEFIDDGTGYTTEYTNGFEKPDDFVGKEVCWFHGKQILTRITDSKENKNKLLLLKKFYFSYIIDTLTYTINYYGTNYQKEAKTSKFTVML